ncbi:MAG TPA: phosphatase domain-containing protein [Planctomicrobium sp.]|nr:phosphatase domain-containing protein [Planctomicrobium sp.]
MSKPFSPRQEKKTAAREVQPREMVVFYRSCGNYSPLGDCWHLQIRGSIFAASHSRIRKGVLLQLFKRIVKPENAIDVRRRFHDRARLFLQDGKKGRSVPIAIAEQSFRLSDTLPNGQFETTITIPAAELEASIQVDHYGRRFVQFCTRLPEADSRLFTGEVELISPEGVSLISDIDDTIKVSNVQNRRELLANTFTREFQSIDGMRELYQQWAKSGVHFHYVSASPWPLYSPLVDWLSTDSFPTGTLHLRHVRLRDFRGDRTREAAFRSKQLAIETLLRLYPHRQFVFCGDSGERDAELYGEVARQFGQQVRHIAIRNCGHGATSLETVAARLAHLPDSRWSIFNDPRELNGLL